MLTSIAKWIKENLGEDSPWHITKFFPAYKLSHIEPTPSLIMKQTFDAAKDVGLTNVYKYDDKGCDCAETNLPVSQFLNGSEEEIYKIKKCAAECCGDEGIVVKKFENEE